MLAGCHDGIIGKLPNGYRDVKGVLHQEVEIRPLTGKEEELVAQNRKQDNSKLAANLLGRCLIRLGAFAPVPGELIQNLSIPDRRYLLLKLREITFGDRVQAVVSCPWPDCEERVDFDFSTQDIPGDPGDNTPHMKLDLDAECPECCREFTIPFDIMSFFFNELQTSLDLLYREVHFLAFHYHWGENEIMAMTRGKRHLYIEILVEEIEKMTDETISPPVGFRYGNTNSPIMIDTRAIDSYPGNGPSGASNRDNLPAGITFKSPVPAPTKSPAVMANESPDRELANQQVPGDTGPGKKPDRENYVEDIEIPGISRVQKSMNIDMKTFKKGRNDIPEARGKSLEIASPASPAPPASPGSSTPGYSNRDVLSPGVPCKSPVELPLKPSIDISSNIHGEILSTQPAPGDNSINSSGIVRDRRMTIRKNPDRNEILPANPEQGNQCIRENFEIPGFSKVEKPGNRNIGILKEEIKKFPEEKDISLTDTSTFPDSIESGISFQDEPQVGVRSQPGVGLPFKSRVKSHGGKSSDFSDEELDNQHEPVSNIVLGEQRIMTKRQGFGKNEIPPGITAAKKIETPHKENTDIQGFSPIEQSVNCELGAQKAVIKQIPETSDIDTVSQPETRVVNQKFLRGPGAVFSKRAPGRRRHINIKSGSEPGYTEEIDSQSPRVAAQRIQQLRRETQRLHLSGETEAGVTSLESGREIKGNHEIEKEEAAEASPSQEQPLTIIRRLPATSPPGQKAKTPDAFWERSYLTRFHLKILR